MLTPRPISISASAQVSSDPGYINELHIEAGVDAATVELSNKVGSGGARVAGVRADAGENASRSFPNGGIFFDTAIYATITGTTPDVDMSFGPAENRS